VNVLCIIDLPAGDRVRLGIVAVIVNSQRSNVLATRMRTGLGCSTSPRTRTTQRYHEATTKTNASSRIDRDATQRLQRGPAMIRARIRRSVERLGQKGEGVAAGPGVVSINQGRDLGRRSIGRASFH
jgi:hypothetical protein